MHCISVTFLQLSHPLIALPRVLQQHFQWFNQVEFGPNFSTNKTTLKTVTLFGVLYSTNIGDRTGISQMKNKPDNIIILFFAKRLWIIIKLDQSQSAKKIATYRMAHLRWKLLCSKWCTIQPKFMIMYPVSNSNLLTSDSTGHYAHDHYNSTMYILVLRSNGRAIRVVCELRHLCRMLQRGWRL